MYFYIIVSDNWVNHFHAKCNLLLKDPVYYTIYNNQLTKQTFKE